MVDEELWQVIPDCPNYEISNLGRVYNSALSRHLVCSSTRDGYVKVNLINSSGLKVTRSVAKMVAEAFVEVPILPHYDPRHVCDQVVLLDGDFTNLSADNLVWRPRWIAWQYREQLTTVQPTHYRNLPVINLRTGIEYESIIDAGMCLGLLFLEIWKSTFTGNPIFPYWDQFQVIRR